MSILYRKNRNIRLVEAQNIDKGKRHYWGDVNGDYGFVQSSNRKNARLKKLLKQTRSEFVKYHKTMNDQQAPDPQNSVEEGYRLYHDIKNSPQTQEKRTGSNGKNQFKISNHIQIHLPAIQKNRSLVIETSPVLQNKQNDKLKKYMSVIQNQKNEQPKSKKRILQIQTNFKDSSHRKIDRAKTETSHYQDQSYLNYLKNYKKVRYTPTFICSLGNPLPVYKLYPDQIKPLC